MVTEFAFDVYAEILASLISDIMFYIGLGIFLSVTDQVQKPYLEFSAKRWSLITGLPGYLPSAFVVMGFKIALPLIALFITWPVLGTSSLVGMVPFLVGCLVQYAFERYLGQHKSSCWPLVPIIFEVFFLSLTNLDSVAFFRK